MKITTADCLVAIDKFWPDFIHAYADLGKQKWKRESKIKNEQGQWVRFFDAFEDRTPNGGYVQTWLKVTETETGLVVSHVTDIDCALLASKASLCYR